MSQENEHIVVGDLLTDLKRQANSPKVRKTQINGTDVGIEVEYNFAVQRQQAEGLIPAIGVADDPPYETTFLRDILIEPQPDGYQSNVKLIYRSPEIVSPRTGGIAIGTQVFELDVGVQQVPLELHPFFASLTPKELRQADLVEQLFLDFEDDTSTITVFFGIELHQYPRGATESGGYRQLTFNGLIADFIRYKTLGVDSYLVPTVIFRRREGFTTVTLSNFGQTGKREYPGHGLPGSAANWLKTAHRVIDHGSFGELAEEWSYSPEGWDSKFNNLYS